MSHRYTKSVWALLCVLLLIVSACQKVTLDDVKADNAPEAVQRNVSVRARAADNSGDELIYPLTVYVLDANGNVKAQRVVADNTTPIEFMLAAGSYTLSAMSGDADFTSGYTTQPLMIGKSNITVGASNVTSTIIMRYAVSSMTVTLSDIPVSVQSVDVSFSYQYASVSNAGEYAGSATVTVPCAKSNDGSWTTGCVYMLPSSSTTTMMSVNMHSAGNDSNCGVTYPTPLLAATPYKFSGVYTAANDEMKVVGTLAVEGWKSEVDGAFTFGPGIDGNFDDIPSDEPDVFYVDDLPEAGDICNGHVVAWVDGTDGLLISLAQGDGMTSAKNTTEPTEAFDIAAEYDEGGITGWTIPTSEQVGLLRELWAGETELGVLSASIEVLGGDPLYVKDPSTLETNRYLCDEAMKTFSFVASGSGSGILEAGATVRTYHLRLVKAVSFVVR